MNLIQIAAISLLSTTHTALAQDCIFTEDQQVGMTRYTFGRDVAIDGNFAIVGDQDTSSIFVYRYNGTEWTEEFTIGNGGPGPDLGFSVDLCGDLMVAGSPNAYVNIGGIIEAGAVQVYRLINDEWIGDPRIIPSDIAPSDYFGGRVACSSGVIAAASRFDSADQRIYIYRFVDNEWTEEKIIHIDRAQYEMQRWSTDDMAMDGNTLVVGFASSGKVLVYDFDGKDWILTQELTSVNHQEYGYFGSSVAIDGDTMVIGAMEDNYPKGPSALGSGTAFVFKNINGEWIEQQRIIPSDGQTEDQFGRSVSISNDTIVVTSPGHDDTGETYVYRHDGSSWTDQVRLKPSFPIDGHNFGRSASIDGNCILIGETSYQFDYFSGSAYFYNYDPEGCLADLTMDCTLDFFDISVFLTYYQLNNTNADFTGDGVYDFFDVSAFLTSFSSGCP